MTQRPRRKRAAPSEIVAPTRSTEVTQPTGEAAQVFQLIDRALQEGRDPAQMTALYDLYERMLARRAKAEFDEAFVAMQPDLPRIKRDGRLEYPVDRNRPQGEKYLVTKYAKWEDIDEGVRPIYTRHGFGLNFRVAPRAQEGGGLVVTAVLRHRNGHENEVPFPVPLDTSGGKNNVQAYGSALSYGKRYAATAVLNIITEGQDDDGVQAGQKFASAEEVAELRALCAEVGRTEEAILRRMFSDAVHSFEELTPGTPVLAVKNMLIGIRQLQQQRNPSGGE